jgi:MinD superfamily P-loop ATPase
MKQLLILSGKGGTGKTTVAGAFIQLAKAKAFADCDVDAPNLHLVMHSAAGPVLTPYYGLSKAIIDPGICIECDLCRKSCRFEAIRKTAEYKVDPFACEGCSVCEFVCPVDAIKMVPSVAGELRIYKDNAVFSTAQLKMGSGTSGKLVTEVKKQMKNAVKELGKEIELAVIDGSPGIGCPVIASISGVDLVLIVAEPSVSGLSDLKRIIDTARQFQTDTVICVNKYDTNLQLTQEIKNLCSQLNLKFVGTIPFDGMVVEATNQGKSIVELDCPSAKAVKEVYEQTIRLLSERNAGHKKPLQIIPIAN